MVATADSNSITYTYRRDARKLRCIHAKSPARLHVALCDLAQQSDAVRPVARPEPTSDVRDFAAAVASSLDGPVLRFSNRKALIKRAEALGIRRFDANLLIAAVQHRLNSDSDKSGKTILPPTTTGRKTWALPLAVVLTMQLAIGVVAYLLLHA